MSYEVRLGGSGEWELVELRPQVVGRFGEEALARRVAGLLALEREAQAAGSAWEGDTFVAVKPAPEAPTVSGMVSIPILTDEQLMAEHRARTAERDREAAPPAPLAPEAPAGDAPPQPPAPSPQPPAPGSRVAPGGWPMTTGSR